MHRLFPLVLAVCALIPSSAAPGEKEGFFTDRELALIDDALALMNMTRRDTEFDKLVLEDDWRLPLVDRTLSRPLEAADVARDWADAASGEPAAILDRAMAVLEPVSRRRGEPLSPEETDRLVSWAYAALVESDSHDGLYPKPDGEPDPEEMLGLAMRAQPKSLFEEAASILRHIDGIDAGMEGIVVAGEGDDVHDLRVDPPRYLIDLGGNDRYIAPARATPDHPLAVVIDLGGDDVYGDGESLSCGAGFFGVGILVDRGGGDDLYLGGHLSQGSGLFGVGVLIDEGGSDVYRCRDTGQGAGAWGIGLLLDRGEGNDTFHADLFGQGFGYVGGVGLLANEKGNDVYDAGGVHLHYPLFNDRFQSLSQGFSIGMRPYASGGVGLLVDDRGNDRYLCDIYGQGASYWFSYGALVDRDGNDTYNLGQYGQGGGIHLAVGVLLDLAGQDLYYNMHGVGTGGAHDFAVGLLVDRAGDDYYAGSGGTMGGSLTNSFALLVDAAGNDGYSAVKVSHAEGGGRAARGMGSIGVLIDMAGKDLHGTRHLDGTAWTKETYGAGIDLPDPPPPTTKPPRRPRLSPEEVEARIRERAWDEAAGHYDLERLWEIAREWAVGEMSDIVPRALEQLHAMGEPALRKALSVVGSRRNLEPDAAQKLLELFGKDAVPPLVEILSDEDYRRRANAARFLAEMDAKEAAPEILPLLGEEKTRRTALYALSRLQAKDLWDAVVPLTADEREWTRVSAVRCLGALDAKAAISTLVRRLGSDEYFTVRFAAEDVLVGFGPDAAPGLLHLARTSDDLTARRHAVRALGRIADRGALAFLTGISDDPDWRVRYDAAGALAGYLPAGGSRATLAREVLEDRARREEHPYVKARLATLLE
jgi:HEAT repeat protein